eukprot:COSAG05_NODE_93_length_19581_cov_53.686685_3_plen_110_part_00
MGPSTTSVRALLHPRYTRVGSVESVRILYCRTVMSVTGVLCVARKCAQGGQVWVKNSLRLNKGGVGSAKPTAAARGGEDLRADPGLAGRILSGTRTDAAQGGPSSTRTC